MLQVTLLLTLSLGVVAAVVQLWIDLRQEKDAVEVSASEFLASVAPSAASAAYNFYDPAAEQVVEGLFTQRAIKGVTIVNEGRVMIERVRDLTPTLPSIGSITHADEVTLSQTLVVPPEVGINAEIGSISIIVDRSVVAPAIVNRMFSYFLLATFKNFVLGLILIALVYGALARHIITIADIARRWRPETGRIKVPPPPDFLRDTELDLLGNQIRELSNTALRYIQKLDESRQAAEQSNYELSERSQVLTEAVETRTAELEAVNARLKHLVERDGLTGLYNRRYFDQKAADMFAACTQQGQSLGVLMIDVDHFKAYNDFYGHQPGDQVLQRIGEILSDIADDTGATVARYGGEEFVALTSEADLSSARLAARIHTALARANLEHQRSLIASRVTVSVGAAASDPAGGGPRGIEALLSAADEALYEAKRTGRNRTVASTGEIRGRAKEQQLATRTIVEAIERCEFEPFLQPQFDLTTGELSGAEALVRWRKPSGQVLTPGAFMAEASAARLVPLIDALVVTKIAAFLREIEGQGLSLPRLSLNATADGLADQAYIESAVALAQASSTALAIELHETVLLDAPQEERLKTLGALRAAGAAIEIDDFGTGRTSILALMAIAPERLKIARELVMPANDKVKHRKVLQNVIGIGRALEVEVVAEGVESAQIAETLVSLGCPIQQGFYHGRPCALGEFSSLYGALMRPLPTAA
ncbi:MAG: EAL domain-containing protein [Pseudomonadota bacterium]